MELMIDGRVGPSQFGRSRPEPASKKVVPWTPWLSANRYSKFEAAMTFAPAGTAEYVVVPKDEVLD